MPIVARSFAQSVRALVALGEVPADAATGARTAATTKTRINLLTVYTPIELHPKNPVGCVYSVLPANRNVLVMYDGNLRIPRTIAWRRGGGGTTQL